MKSGLGSALAAVLLSVAFVASAADDTPAAAPTATAPATPPAAIPALEIPGRAERATAELYRQRAALRPDPAVDRVVADLPAMRASLEQLSSETWLDGLTSRELEDVARQWRRSDDRLADWARIVTRRNQVVEDGMARVVRALLEDDILSRLELPRGVPSVISAAANYGILLAGFLFAVSAAGLDLSRVTILAGAFGVGIGFGLQNVVNNFVSGLILLFERLLQIGDVIDVAGVSGRVRRIGIRSSTIETFDGAEVIVPNGTLIAERVTNWTASHQGRRIDVPVSILYGGEPEPVLALLKRVAGEHADVLRQPPPEALLNGFGPGSLDFILRVWVRYDHAITARSDLVLAVDEGLRAAGIAIPVPPQRAV